MNYHHLHPHLEAFQANACSVFMPHVGWLYTFPTVLDCILDQYQPDAHPQQQQHDQEEQQQQPLDSSSGPHSRTELQHFCAPLCLLLNLCLVDISPLSQSSASWCSSQRGAAAVSSGSPAALAAAVVKEAAPYPRWQQLLTEVIRVQSRYLQYMAAADEAAAAAGEGAAAAAAAGEGAAAAAAGEGAAVEGKGARAAAAAGKGAAAAAGKGAAAEEEEAAAAAAAEGAAAGERARATAAGGDAVQALETSLQYKGTVVALSQKPARIMHCEMAARLGLLSAVTSLLGNGLKDFFYEADVSWWVLGQLAAMVKLTGRVHNARIRRQLEQQRKEREEGQGQGEQPLQGPVSGITDGARNSSRSGERISSSSSGRGNSSCSSREVTMSGFDTNTTSSSNPSCSSSSSTGASSREWNAAAAGGRGGRTSSNEKVIGHGWDPTSAVLLEVPFPQQRIQQYAQGTCSRELVAGMEQLAGSGRSLAECKGDLKAKALQNIKEYEAMLVRGCGR